MPSAAWKEEDVAVPASLTPVQRAAVLRQMQRAALDANAAQTVLDVLAHRLALARDHGTGTPPEPVSYTRGLLRRLAAGTLDDTDALPIRAARAAAERAERAAAASAARTAPAAPETAPERTQPSEDLRAQLRAAARGRKS